MFRITTQIESGRTVLKVEGKLLPPWTHELEKCWIHCGSNGMALVLDLRSVTVISSEGKELLSRMHHAGAKLMTSGVLMNAVAEQLTRRSQMGEENHP